MSDSVKLPPSSVPTRAFPLLPVKNSPSPTSHPEIFSTTVAASEIFRPNALPKGAAIAAFPLLDSAAPIKTTAKPQLQMSPRQQLLMLAQKYHVAIPAGEQPDAYQKEIIQAVVKGMAAKHGIPQNIALGISGHESGGWKMWENVSKGTLVKGVNRNKRGETVSTDWGVMQINDKAHPKAFPRVKQDLEYNIEFSMRLLKGFHADYAGDLKLGFAQWDKTIASYNQGSPPTSKSRRKQAARYIRGIKRYADGQGPQAT